MTWEGMEENYNVFRWYRAGWGRYTQADPLGITKTLSVYDYAQNRPAVLIDPQGLQATQSTLSGDPFMQPCCDKALAQGWFDPPGQQLGGLVICCNGSKVACARRHAASGMNASARMAYGLSVQCVLEHEKSHVADLPNCPCGSGVPPVQPAQFQTLQARAASECKAATIEIACPERSKQLCHGDPQCENYLQALKAGPVGLRQQFGCK